MNKKICRFLRIVRESIINMLIIKGLPEVYRLLEPGPVVLVTTARKGRANIMTMSWHTMLEFEPPIVGCGNASGQRVDKFREFRLTPEPASLVAVPLIAECYANLECKVVDTRMVAKYNFFILLPSKMK